MNRQSRDDLPLFAWSPPPKVIPFPLVRRRPLIHKAAHQMLVRGRDLGSHDPVKTGEKLLAATLRRQREAMERRGIAAEIIEREIGDLESAIRCEYARLLATGAVA